MSAVLKSVLKIQQGFKACLKMYFLNFTGKNSLSLLFE